MRTLGAVLIELVINALGPGRFRLRMVKLRHRLIGPGARGRPEFRVDGLVTDGTNAPLS